MERTIRHMIEKLQKLNENNLKSDSFEYLEKDDFPMEYHGLIDAVNQSMQVSNDRVLKELETQNNILTVLCSDYLSVNRLDLITGGFEIHKMTKRLRAEVADIAKTAANYDEAMQRYVEGYVAEEDQEEVLRKCRRDYVTKRLETRDSFFVGYRIKGNVQNMKNMEVHFARAVTWGDDSGVIVGFRNVDERMRKEEAYKLETRHDIEETLEGSRTGLWAIEMEDGCEPRMYPDKTMCKLLGVESDISPEKCYKEWFDRIEPDCVELVLETVEKILKVGRAEVVYPWNHPTLGEFYVRCGGVPDYKFEKNGIRLKGYHQDITETMVTRKEQEKALMEALMEAKRANTAKTEFLSHMSHDIRTPINGILGMLDISEMNAEDQETQKECRGKIRTAAEHLLSLINDVLDISKLESGTLELAEEPFHIRTLMDGCESILKSQAQERGIDMIENIEASPHESLIGSPLHLRQILINIIGNAIKYNDPDGKIYIRVSEIDEENGNAIYRFEIKDTGIGMSEEFQKHLFEPFTQEANNARTYYQGTGLGMAITKNLVEQMHGRIEVQSSLGQGSTFIVTLPLKIDDEPELRKKKSSEDNEIINLKGVKVLLAEDNELNREIARYMLEDAGITVEETVNGKEAAETFEQSETGEFSCILMDVMMPVMDGIEATRKIRAADHADAAKIPIIAMTANAFAEDIKKVKDAGMNEHLAKPVNAKKMLQVIAQYCKEI